MNKWASSIRGLVRRATGFFCASVRLRQNAYTSQKLGLNFCLTLTLRLMGGGNHALHYDSICLGLPVGTPARVCLGTLYRKVSRVSHGPASPGDRDSPPAYRVPAIYIPPGTFVWHCARWVGHLQPRAAIHLPIVESRRATYPAVCSKRATLPADLRERSARGTQQAAGMLRGQLFGPGGNTTPECWIDGRRIWAAPKAP
jgi:hypothetical protein